MSPRGISVLLVVALSSAWAQPNLSDLDFAAGKALFDRNWVPAPASTASADGLGPHYTARSCAACHPDGGRAAAPAGFGVHLDDPVLGQRLQPYSVGPVTREATLQWHHEQQPGPDRLAWTLAITNVAHDTTIGSYSIRQATSLHGLALLEAIPRGTIAAMADPQDRDGDGISGRLALLPDDRLGRFGWKAATASLRDQLMLALKLDLGLGTSGHPEPAGDCTTAQQACLELANVTADPVRSLEADDTVVELLHVYLQGLPPPRALSAEPAQLFETIGCADCHVPRLDSALGEVAAYTDLLLHDLGPGLDDGLAEGAALSAEWRTAPLWSLPPDGPYLHDGRARTLDEAVHWHGGEAAASRQAWQALEQAERDVLIAFLLGVQ